MLPFSPKAPWGVLGAENKNKRVTTPRKRLGANWLRMARGPARAVTETREPGSHESSKEIPAATPTPKGPTSSYVGLLFHERGA